MNTARARPYAKPEDLRAMQRLAQRIWSPASLWHIGDLAWQRNEHLGREPEWPTAIWEADGEPVAWGWAELPDTLALQVDPARPDLAAAVLEWFADVARASSVTTTVLDAETHLITALDEHGFACQDTPHFQVHMSHPLTKLPQPMLPDGFRARPVSGTADLAGRVGVHRAAWHPSRVTKDSYRNVMATWPYRTDLDRVVEAPDGRLVANCLIWLDERNQVGELEPVGTDPRFRRRGLGIASRRPTEPQGTVTAPSHNQPEDSRPSPERNDRIEFRRGGLVGAAEGPVSAAREVVEGGGDDDA